jgi:hypothetical protein
MSITTAHAGVPERPVGIVAAVALTVIAAVFTLATIPLTPDDAPAAIVPLSIAYGVIALGGAWGLWHGSKWAAVVVFAVTLLNGLAAAPGIVFAGNIGIQVLCAIGVLQTIAVCWLLLLDSTRSALR